MIIARAAIYVTSKSHMLQQYMYNYIWWVALRLTDDHSIPNDNLAAAFANTLSMSDA